MWEDLTSTSWLLFRFLGCAFSHRNQACLLIKLVSPILSIYYTHTSVDWWPLEMEMVLKNENSRL